MHQLYFPNGFEKTKVRWEKIKIKLAHNVLRLGAVPHTQNLIINHFTLSGIALNRCYVPFFINKLNLEI